MESFDFCDLFEEGMKEKKNLLRNPRKAMPENMSMRIIPIMNRKIFPIVDQH